MADSFPKFYAVGPDDVVVRIDSDGKEVRGTVMLTGLPYPPVKALIEGGEISESEAIRTKPERANKPHLQLQIGAPADLPIWHILPSTFDHCLPAECARGKPATTET